MHGKVQVIDVELLVTGAAAKVGGRWDLVDVVDELLDERGARPGGADSEPAAYSVASA